MKNDKIVTQKFGCTFILGESKKFDSDLLKVEAILSKEELTQADKARRKSFEAVLAEASEIDSRIPDYNTITDTIKIF